MLDDLGLWVYVLNAWPLGIIWNSKKKKKKKLELQMTTPEKIYASLVSQLAVGVGEGVLQLITTFN